MKRMTRKMLVMAMIAIASFAAMSCDDSGDDDDVETNIATDIVADGKAYKTLAEAIAAKPENIKLLKDFEVADTLTIPEGG